ncbi:hypothetical protein GCM10008968_18790 [Bacillus horti]
MRILVTAKNCRNKYNRVLILKLNTIALLNKTERYGQIENISIAILNFFIVV